MGSGGGWSYSCWLDKLNKEIVDALARSGTRRANGVLGILLLENKKGFLASWFSAFGFLV